jgi:hypothetical protein
MGTLTKERRAAFDRLGDEVGPTDLFDRSYWLSNCEGFRVEFPGGAHGYVEEVRYRGDPDRAALLAVRVGRLGARVVVVPVDEVRFIVPRAERIWLRSPLEIARMDAAPARAAHRR